MVRLNRYHRQRTIASFRAALKVDISALLLDPPVRSWMKQAISDNVDLIKTIPKTFHEGLKKRLEKELAEAPFDRARLTKLFRDEYKLTGYKVRRLARDQTT